MRTVSTTINPVVVGFDGSARSLDAVLTGATEAARRGLPLRIVGANVWPTLHIGTPPGIPQPPAAALRESAEEELIEAVKAASAAAPELSVTSALIDGAPSSVLLAESRSASLLVLGDRGMGAFTGLIIGSVAVQVVTYASCPVMVVRGTTRQNGPVVAGVDGSAASADALDLAAEEAVLRGADLVVAHAYRASEPYNDDPLTPPAHDAALVEEQQRKALVELTADVTQRYPQLTIHHEATRDSPGQLLVERSRLAQVVVVGSRGRGGFAGLLLGSVSQHLIYHADCPVLVVRRGEATAI
ncbi:universal stress protein [Actinoplanes sp. NPDC024001]|uniref:universal stress protein n=1 Tax=Actinoplanes sp. NPDC024001 TaxID=3154598 RepID=UPI0033EC9212